MSFLVLQYLQNMYLKFKLVNYLAKPIFLSSKLANLPSRMSALSRGQNDKYDVKRFGVSQRSGRNKERTLFPTGANAHEPL